MLCSSLPLAVGFSLLLAFSALFVCFACVSFFLLFSYDLYGLELSRDDVERGYSHSEGVDPVTEAPCAWASGAKDLRGESR